jgi:hypothetical protein
MKIGSRLAMRSATWTAIGFALLACAAQADPPPASYIRIYSNGGQLGCNPIMFASNGNQSQPIRVVFLDKYSTTDVGGTHSGEAAMPQMTFLPNEAKQIGCSSSDSVGMHSTHQYSILSASY